MIGTSGYFRTIKCPDDKCQRPYCHFKHSDGERKTILTSDSTTSTTYTSSNETIPMSNNIYDNNYYNQQQYSLYNPSNFVSNNLNSVQSGTNSMYNVDYAGYYSGITAANDYSPEASMGYYTQALNSYSAYLPVAPSYNMSNIGYTVPTPPITITLDASTDENDEEEKKIKIDVDNVEENEKPLKKKRKLSEDEYSNKKRIPPDLGNDPLLKSLKKKNEKKSSKLAPPSVSKKAKRQPQKALTTNNRKVRTDEFNQCVQQLAEIDKKIAELQKESTGKKKITDIDSLFDDDEPPAPVKKSLSSSSKSSSISAKPSSSRKSSDLSASVSNDVIIIDPPLSSKSNVSKTVEKPKEPITSNVASSSDSIPSTGSSKRIAHKPGFSVNPKEPPLKTPMQRRMTLQQQLQRRKEIAEEEAAKKQTTIPSSFSNTTGKVRVAHTMKNKPYQSDIRLPPAKPEPIDLKSRKFPIMTRQKMLQKLMDELIKFMPESDAIKLAQKDEHELMLKMTKQSGYLAGANGLLRKYREMNGSILSKPSHNKISHLDVMKGKYKGSISIGVHAHCKKHADRVKEMTESELYAELFDKYLLSDEDLENNGYPLWEDEMIKNKIKIKLSEGKSIDDVFVDDKNPFRKCCRCNKTYRIKVNEDDIIEEEDCDYHWGKLWKKKEHGTWVSKYTCCSGDSQSGGCCLAKSHVNQMYKKSMLNEFVEAPSRRGDYDERSTRIMALDCEMVYTTNGCEVARLSVVDFKGENILDALIRPYGDVIDTNYRFSGLKIEDIHRANMNLKEAQRKFFEIINKDSILIGHSLESDLKSMRIVHKNIIDTTILYPHKHGPPYKRALKNLSSEILMKIIQEDITGHDSSEDARITLELVLHKLMNE